MTIEAKEINYLRKVCLPCDRLSVTQGVREYFLHKFMECLFRKFADVRKFMEVRKFVEKQDPDLILTETLNWIDFPRTTHVPRITRTPTEEILGGSKGVWFAYYPPVIHKNLRYMVYWVL